MPIYLPAPKHDPRGPDGQGWNRLGLHFATLKPQDQCALRPRDTKSLREMQDTRRARWGGYGVCPAKGACEGCAVFHDHFEFDPLADRVLVRVDHRGHAWLMDKPHAGWSSKAIPVTWQQLALIDGWQLGSDYRDKHSRGFWLVREPVLSEN